MTRAAIVFASWGIGFDEVVVTTTDDLEIWYGRAIANYKDHSEDGGEQKVFEAHHFGGKRECKVKTKGL